MEAFAQDLISLLQYLIPGLVAAWIFYSFTSYNKPSQFERVIQALIFTLIIQTATNGIIAATTTIGEHWSLGAWTNTKETSVSLVLAVIIGILAAYIVNSDKLHKFLRKHGITKETSYPSEWYGTFHKNITFIVLHLKDERRLYGWPVEWPSDPTKGHFLIADPSWQLDDGSESRVVGAAHLLLDVCDVKWVEFLDKTWEENNG